MIACAEYSFCQAPLVDDFLGLVSYSPKKVEAFISKKGFRSTGTITYNDSLIDTWQQVGRPTSTDSVQRRIWRYQDGESAAFGFLTTSRGEFDAAVNHLKSSGFRCPGQEIPMLLQRKNFQVRGMMVNEDSLQFYSLLFQQQKLPPSRSIRYADDLLQFSSHEMLLAFFGAAYVTMGRFDGENNGLSYSTLFAGTPKEAMFVWKDGMNLMDLDHIILGGRGTADDAAYSGPMIPSTWTLKNGLYFNMRLDQLIKLNEDDILFFGRRSDYYLNVKQEKKSRIDFASTGVILDCLNCDGSAVLDRELVSAAEALNHSLRLHIGTIILFPGKD